MCGALFCLVIRIPFRDQFYCTWSVVKIYTFLRRRQTTAINRRRDKPFGWSAAVDRALTVRAPVYYAPNIHTQHTHTTRSRTYHTQMVERERGENHFLILFNVYTLTLRLFICISTFSSDFYSSSFLPVTDSSLASLLFFFFDIIITISLLCLGLFAFHMEL